MLEKHLQKQILDYLNNEPYTYPMKTIVMNKRGLPDIIACYRGNLVYIEVKAPGKPKYPTKLQEYRMHELSSAGAHGFVTNSFNDFLQQWKLTKQLFTN